MPVNDNKTGFTVLQDIASLKPDLNKVTLDNDENAKYNLAAISGFIIRAFSYISNKFPDYRIKKFLIHSEKNKEPLTIMIEIVSLKDLIFLTFKDNNVKEEIIKVKKTSEKFILQKLNDEKFFPINHIESRHNKPVISEKIVKLPNKYIHMVLNCKESSLLDLGDCPCTNHPVYNEKEISEKQAIEIIFNILNNQ